MLLGLTEQLLALVLAVRPQSGSEWRQAAALEAAAPCQLFVRAG
jgi:hypothetical protein